MSDIADPKKNTASKKPATSGPAARKPTAKKLAAKKPAAKKPAAKKPAAKKPTVKKPAASRSAAKAAAPAQASKASDKAKVSDKATINEESDMNQNQTASEKSSDQNSWQDSEVVQDLKNRNWGYVFERALFTVLFSVIGFGAMYVAATLVFVQFIVMVVMGKPNDLIKVWTVWLADYIATVLQYLSYQTEDKPMPFAPEQAPDASSDDKTS